MICKHDRLTRTILPHSRAFGGRAGDVPGAAGERQGAEAGVRVQNALRALCPQVRERRGAVEEANLFGRC